MSLSTTTPQRTPHPRRSIDGKAISALSIRLELGDPHIDSSNGEGARRVSVEYGWRGEVLSFLFKTPPLSPIYDQAINTRIAYGEKIMENTVQGQYAKVNGLEMYYEVHGSGGTPLVLIHGAFSAIGTSFSNVLPGLARGRQVIGVDMQAHGRTADIDRPLHTETMADDVAALLKHLNIAQADIFGYSMGSAVALNIAIRYPQVVRKVVLMSTSYLVDGLHPGMLDGLAGFQPEWLHGTPWHTEYMAIAPRPEDFPILARKVTELNMRISDVPADSIRGITAPVLILNGDSDIITLEHTVAMFRLLGGGVNGDLAGLATSQLGILPGTSHSMMVDRADMVIPMITRFLDAPMPE